MKIVIDVKKAIVLRRAHHPDKVALVLEDGGEILTEGVSDAYSKLCDGRFDLDFTCPQGTAEKLLDELGLKGITSDLEVIAVPKNDAPFSSNTGDIPGGDFGKVLHFPKKKT